MTRSQRIAGDAQASAKEHAESDQAGGAGGTRDGEGEMAAGRARHAAAEP